MKRSTKTNPLNPPLYMWYVIFEQSISYKNQFKWCSNKYFPAWVLHFNGRSTLKNQVCSSYRIGYLSLSHWPHVLKFQNELQKLEKQLESSEADKSQLSMSLKETKEHLEKTRGELTSQQVSPAIQKTLRNVNDIN